MAKGEAAKQSKDMEMMSSSVEEEKEVCLFTSIALSFVQTTYK